MYSQLNMVCRSCILVSLILSSFSLEYGLKEYLLDSKGYQGITRFWEYPCPITWSTANNNELITCFPKIPEKASCTALSVSYNVREAKELYVNIQTMTRKCKQMKYLSNCTDKFYLSINYQVNESNYKRLILPDEIPKTVFKKDKKEIPFVYANDTVSFSVDQNYKSMKLGFQAPFYCGSIKSVSVYYYLCPAKTNALVDFPEVTAPSKKSSPYTSFGICTRNAVKKSSSRHLSMNCYYNGTAEVFGGCECEAGYTKNKNICKG